MVAAVLGLATALVLVAFAALYAVVMVARESRKTTFEVIAALERVAVTNKATSATEAATAQKMLEMPVEQMTEPQEQSEPKPLQINCASGEEIVPMSAGAEALFKELAEKGLFNDDDDDEPKS